MEGSTMRKMPLFSVWKKATSWEGGFPFSYSFGRTQAFSECWESAMYNATWIDYGYSNVPRPGI
jgi:hypothetical protein